jgi:beta-galactosidase
MFRYGADYYPEHWPEERWPEDARLMQEAGFNVVRLAEFGWARMEPRDGHFDFDWLDRAIAVLAERGIDVVLGTPTASPPPWLMHLEKEFFIVDADGRRQTYGLRREYCPNHLLYRQYSERIALRMAEKYASHPAVIGWQIDNEFGDRCYCDICRGEFQQWLRVRYGSLDALNEQWGTVFWSHIYTDWEQIPVPLETGKSANPGLGLDYRRFMSDTYRGYQRLQIDILRCHCPGHFITHNLMGFGYGQLDYYDNAADLDFVSWDNYWRYQWDMGAAIDPCRAALSHDAMRGLKKKNFWVMEQQSGGGGWEMVAVPPKPGEMRLWAYQAIARGADGIVYFRWRTCRTGTEQYWHGILDHHGIPGRRYEEAAQMGGEIERIGETLLEAQVRPRVAVMQSYDTRFAFQIQPNNPRFGYEAHVQDVYRGFYDANVPVEVISEKDPLVGYQVVAVPAMYVLSEETAANLARFAASGGVVIFTPRTGVKNEVNAVVEAKLPGLVAEMCGVEVEEYVSMPVDEDNQIALDLPDSKGRFTAAVWADVLKPTTAAVVARYTRDYYADQAAVTINACGDGQVIYLGTMGNAEFYGAIARWALALAGIEPLLDAPIGVEIAERWQGERRLLFLLNHGEETQTFPLDGKYRELLSGNQVADEASIGPRDLLILDAGP